MKPVLGLMAIALSVWLAHGEAMAEDANVPNLVGTWTGPFTAMREKGVADGSLTLRVVEQDGPLLRAEKSWESPGVPGDVGGKAVEEATEPLVGVVDFDGEQLSEKALAEKYGVRFTPTFQFFARDAKVPPGKAAHEAETWRQNGLLPPFATHVLFKYVAEGAYRAGPFDAYLRAEHAASVASGGKAHTW